MYSWVESLNYDYLDAELGLLKVLDLRLFETIYYVFGIRIAIGDLSFLPGRNPSFNLTVKALAFGVKLLFYDCKSKFRLFKVTAELGRINFLLLKYFEKMGERGHLIVRGV